MQYLLGKLIVFSCPVQFFYIAAHQPDHIVDDFVSGTLVNHIVGQEVCQIQQGFQIIVDTILPDKVRHIALCVNEINDFYAVNFGGDRKLLSCRDGDEG